MKPNWINNVWEASSFIVDSSFGQMRIPSKAKKKEVEGKIPKGKGKD